MKTRNFARCAFSLFVFLLLAEVSYACFTTVINDKGYKIMVYNKNDNTIIPIPRHGKRRFGKSTEHALFAIHLQQPHSQVFSEVYVCKQNECGKKGNIRLKVSDIENNTGATHLFTITRNEPYVSMVQKVTGVKKDCRRCDHRHNQY